MRCANPVCQIANRVREVLLISGELAERAGLYFLDLDESRELLVVVGKEPRLLRLDVGQQRNLPVVRFEEFAVERHWDAPIFSAR